MMRDPIDFETLEPDIVEIVLQKVMALAPGFSEALARQIEREVKAQHGGRRLYVHKGGAKRLTPEQRQEIYQDGLTSLPDEVITEKHKISKTTLWRVMKAGGGRFR